MTDANDGDRAGDAGLDRRRLGLFAAFAFGIAWATAAVLSLNGGLVDSPVLVSSGPISLTLAG